MPVIVEEWIGQSVNLRRECEKIRGVRISSRTWYEWERLAGASYAQGKKVANRQYTQEQTELLLCLAWLRRHYPKKKVTYRSLREFSKSNEWKYDEVLEKFCKEEPFVADEVKEPPPKIALSEVKKCCDRIMNRELSRNCWASWKQYLGIPKYERFVDEGIASLLTYMACWRHDHPTKKFPLVRQLIVMMTSGSRRAMTMETASSAKMWHQWRMKGCIGKDLARYLAMCGYRVSIRTLYKWGDFSQRRHYSVSELAQWKEKASKKRSA
jgi:hypothetical protein